MKKILKSGNIIFTEFEAERRGLTFKNGAMINNTNKAVCVREAYYTTANGWSDLIMLAPGETLREITPGDAYNFGKYELSQC